MNKTASAILGKDNVAAVRRPLVEANGLPSLAYTSDQFFDLEQNKFFRRSWMAVAFTGELPDVGDAMPIEVADLPLLLLRDSNGEIQAFHNACRHRGMMVLPTPCKHLKHVRCPYHAWTYGLDGQLNRAPFFDGTATGNSDQRLDDVGLVPVRCAVWHHWIFVNVDGNAPTIDQHMAPYMEFMNQPMIDQLAYAEHIEWEYDANWKLAADNWENYHHPWVHDGVFERLADDIDMKTGKPWSAALSSGSVLTLRRVVENAPPYHFKHTGLPKIPFPDGNERITAPSFILPNLEIAMVWDNVSSIIYQPLSPTRTRVKLASIFHKDAASADEHAEGRNIAMNRWLGPSRSIGGNDGVRNQDFAVFAKQQVAKRSPVADITVFSSVWEQNVHYFQNRLLDFLEA
jgi:choline monooxygenase